MLRAERTRGLRLPAARLQCFRSIRLKNEHGFSYDAGVSFDVDKKNVYKLDGSATWFNS